MAGGRRGCRLGSEHFPPGVGFLAVVLCPLVNMGNVAPKCLEVAPNRLPFHIRICIAGFVKELLEHVHGAVRLLFGFQAVRQRPRRRCANRGEFRTLRHVVKQYLSATADGTPSVRVLRWAPSAGRSVRRAERAVPTGPPARRASTPSADFLAGKGSAGGRRAAAGLASCQLDARLPKGRLETFGREIIFRVTAGKAGQLVHG